MKFVVVGAGAVGLSLCERLATNQHDVVLVEKNEENLGKVVSSLDVQIVTGNGCSPEVLTRAGVATADYLISVADQDEVNIAACLISKLVNPNAKRVARIRELSLVHRDIGDDHVHDYFDLIINPDQAAADALLQSFKVPGAKEVVDFGDGRLRVLALGVAPGSPLVDRKLTSFHELRNQFPILLIAIMRGNRLIVPRGSDQIKVGDTIYAITLPEKTSLLFELVGKELNTGRMAMIWGDDFLARSLIRSLEEQGTQVKVICSDPAVGHELADECKGALILQGDGTDHNLLLEENIADVDAFISVTDHEEDNILAAILAKRLGAKTSMAVVNKMTYLPLVSAIGVDVVVSPRLEAAAQIFQHIHSESVISEFSIAHHDAGFIELYATEDMVFTGTPIQEIKFPYGILITAILREEEVIIPRGEDVILPGDRVVIFVVKSSMKKLEKLLHLKIELFI